MRVGKLVVVSLVSVTVAVASGSWWFQRRLMLKRVESRSHASPEMGATAPEAAGPRPGGERRAAPGGVPADAQVPAATNPAPAEVAAAGGVPGEWADRNAEAIRALEQGEIERALELFESCRAAYPDLEVFRRNLAEALVRAAVREHEQNSRCSLCLERLERAVELAPDRTELADLLERWRRERSVEGEFWRESSLHFELSYDGLRRDLLWGSTRLLDGLERAYTDLGELFAFYPVEGGRPKFRVVLYERAGFSLLTGLGDWSGGAFDGSAIRIPIGDLAAEEWRLERVFRHELCHAFVRAIGGDGVPGWLNEGLSQWLEPVQEARRDEEARAARQALAGQELYSLETLAGSLASWKDEAAIRRAYQQSLAFVGHLWRQFGQRAVLGMIEAGKSGKTPAQAFEAETRQSLQGVFEEWSRR
ncbi:MAG: hypothetical protein IPK67_04840 [Planctomycetes bacterium]|nr:hypothetical protein [Planctomycetota bacterium]